MEMPWQSEAEVNVICNKMDYNNQEFNYQFQNNNYNKEIKYLTIIIDLL